VKAYRGEPSNEEADIRADKAISGKDDPMEWHDRTNRAVFTWQEPRLKGDTVSYEDKSRRGTAGCGRRLDEDQQKIRCASTGIVRRELGNRSANKDDELM